MNNRMRIYDIQRCSIHDGPGIRTTVFLKGCPLRCPWCSNPESQKTETQLMYFENHCTSCRRCASVCPNQAIRYEENKPVFDRERCDCCGNCVKACLSDAIKLVGKVVSVGDIMEIVRKDKEYYKNTGGGITISGGEPLYQEAVIDLLSAAKSEGLHTAIETTGNVAEEVVRQAIPLTDLFLFDLKSADHAKLKKITGANLEQILKNLDLVIENNDTMIRVPVIPQFNHSLEEMEQIFRLSLAHGAKRIDVLPYHILGKNKYERLGLPYPWIQGKALERKDLLQYTELGKKLGMQVTIAGKHADEIDEFYGKST